MRNKERGRKRRKEKEGDRDRDRDRERERGFEKMVYKRIGRDRQKEQ
jgi:hypothetical protein